METMHIVDTFRVVKAATKILKTTGRDYFIYSPCSYEDRQEWESMESNELLNSAGEE